MLPLAAASLALLCMGVLFVPPRAVTVAMGDVHGYNTRRLPALSVLFVLCLLCVFRVAPYQLLTAVVLAMLTLFMRDLFGKWITACCSHLYFSLFSRATWERSAG